MQISLSSVFTVTWKWKTKTEVVTFGMTNKYHETDAEVLDKPPFFPVIRRHHLKPPPPQVDYAICERLLN